MICLMLCQVNATLSVKRSEIKLTNKMVTYEGVDYPREMFVPGKLSTLCIALQPERLDFYYSVRSGTTFTEPVQVRNYVITHYALMENVTSLCNAMNLVTELSGYGGYVLRSCTLTDCPMRILEPLLISGIGFIFAYFCMIHTCMWKDDIFETHRKAFIIEYFMTLELQETFSDTQNLVDHIEESSEMYSFFEKVANGEFDHDLDRAKAMLTSSYAFVKQHYAHNKGVENALKKAQKSLVSFEGSGVSSQEIMEKGSSEFNLHSSIESSTALSNINSDE